MTVDKIERTNLKTLTIDSPAKFGVLIEKGARMEHSIFKKIYDDVKGNVRDIIIANNDKSDDSKECFVNTTIAFVGERGTGKSSAMTSLSSWLEDNGTKAFEEEYNTSCKFYSLPIIDANQLGTNETIIGRISAALMTEYFGFQSKLLTESKRSFIQKVKTVNDLAVKYRSGEWFKTSDNLLDDTVSISKMRQNVEDLIKCFLKLHDSDSCDNKYLVISIDDIDMGIENSYSIMEEIRKFLCVTNVIVFVTLDVKQLEMILNASYLKTLGKTNVIGSWQLIVESLSYRYIEKLFPYSRQHKMPELTLQMLKSTYSEKFLANNLESNDEEWKISGVLDRTDAKTPSVFNSILHMIWRKTSLILIPNSDGDHLLVPRNLRSLYNMVVFLRNLPDAVKITRDCNNKVDIHTDISTAIDGLDAFKGYLLDNLETFEVHDMSNSDLSMSKILLGVIDEFSDMTLTTMNSKIVADILYKLHASKKVNIYKAIFFNNDSKENGGKSSAQNILDAAVYPDAISMGDLMYVIGKIDAKTKCRYINYLIEIIRTLWSIEMTKEYHKGKDDSESGKKKGIVTNVFRRAVGGLIINPDETKFCYKKGEDEEDDIYKKIWYIYDADRSERPDAVNLCSDESQESKNSIEYMLSMMTVCKTTKTNGSWRKVRVNAGPYYDLNLTSLNKEICCHPYAIISRLVDKPSSNSLQGIIGLSSDESLITNSPLMPIPLYSLDFVYRWYEIMRHYMKSQTVNNELESFPMMFDIGKAGGLTGNTGEGQFLTDICQYMPEVFIDNIINQPLRNIRDSIQTLISKIPDAVQDKSEETLNTYLKKSYTDEDWKAGRSQIKELMQDQKEYSDLIAEMDIAEKLEEFKGAIDKIYHRLNGEKS